MQICCSLLSLFSRLQMTGRMAGRWLVESRSRHPSRLCAVALAKVGLSSLPNRIWEGIITYCCFLSGEQAVYSYY